MPGCNPAAFSDAPRSFREHYYETTDSMAAVAARGYFAPAAHRLATGDLIRVRAGMGGAIAYREFFVAHGDDGTVAVTVTPPGDPPAPALRRFPRNRRGRG